MEIGVPREIRPDEFRVGLTPAGVDTLTKSAHTVYVERGAGLGAGFSDATYQAVGAQLAYSAEEVWRRARLVVKVSRPTAAEYEYFQGQTLLSFLHLPVASPDLPEALRRSEMTVIAAELIQTDDGTFSVLLPTSQVAGRLAPIIAGRLLETMPPHRAGDAPEGRGILLSGAPGIPPANVVILGAGVVGSNAARAFRGVGSQVTVLDDNVRRLERLERWLDGQIVTMVATSYNIEKAVGYADVLIGAVHVPGQRAPVLVTRAMVRKMRPRAVIIDFAIDEGGCVETSRPTTHRDPVFVAEDVIHYCVPNVPARVARTASHAFSNAVLPYVASIANQGVSEALRSSPALRRGLALRHGEPPQEGAP